MKKTKHIFTTIGLIILTTVLLLAVTSCNNNASASVSTTPPQKNEEPVKIVDTLPNPTEKGYVAKFVNNNRVVDKFAFSDELTFPEAPAKMGYFFRGWSDDVNVYEAGTTVAGFGVDKTFTAVWEQCTITIIRNDDMNLEITIPAEIIYTTPPTAGCKSCAFAPVNYTFVAWKLTEIDGDGEVVEVREIEPGTTIIVNNSIILEAIWELPNKK